MIAGGLHLMEITMKYVSVSETKMTSIGLMRPGIPYALDETFQPHALVLGLIKTKKLDAKILNDDDAAALLHVGLAHYPDDMGAPLAAQTIVASLAEKAAEDAAKLLQTPRPPRMLRNLLRMPRPLRSREGCRRCQGR